MTLHIALSDREGALERLLSTCRRRGLALRGLQAMPREDGGLDVEIALDPGDTPASRVTAILYRIHDIVGIEARGAAARAA